MRRTGNRHLVECANGQNTVYHVIKYSEEWAVKITARYYYYTAHKGQCDIQK